MKISLTFDTDTIGVDGLRSAIRRTDFESLILGLYVLATDPNSRPDPEERREFFPMQPTPVGSTWVGTNGVRRIIPMRAIQYTIAEQALPPATIGYATIEGRESEVIPPVRILSAEVRVD